MLDPLSNAQAVNAEEARAASALWWVLLLYGVLSVVVGLYILAHNWTVGSLATFVGIVLIVEGIFTAVSPGLGSMRNWNIALGILAMVAGIAILVWPAVDCCSWQRLLLPTSWSRACLTWSSRLAAGRS